MKRKLKLFITLALCFLTLGLVFAGCGKSDSGEESTKSEPHSIVIDDEIRFGTVVADKTSARSGETVNLTVHPDISYTLKPGSLKYSALTNNGSSATTIEGLSFTMPAYDIKITAEFEKIKYDITVPAQQTGYQIVSLDDRPIQNLKIEHGSALIFKVNLDAAHNQSTPVVKQNGSIMTPDLNGVYRTIVSGNISLSVENIELNVYAIVFQDENGNTISSKSDYHHGDVVIKPADQTKASDNPDAYTWIFEGWRDENNVLTTISTATKSATYHPSFVRSDVEYTLTIPNNVSVTKGGIAQTSVSTLHYGDLIVITYTPSQSMFMNEFAVSGATPTENANEYRVTGNVTITYTESSSPRADSLEKLAFVYDNQNNTASVRAASTNISGAVIIPSSVYNSGNIYTVTSIPTEGFKNLTNVTKIVVPNSVTTIGAGSFKGCSSLVEITIPFVGGSSAPNPGPSSLFGYIFGTTAYGTGTTQLYNANVEIVDYEAQITPTGYETFAIPTSLRKVNVTGGVMLFAAFSNCSMLTEINIQGTVPSQYFSPWDAGSIGTVNSQLGLGTFYGCTNLETLTLCEGITGIEFGTCYSCSNLESVTLPNSLTYIGYAAFNLCGKLDNVIIPANVTTIGDFAFFDNKLTSLTFAENSHLATIGQGSFQDTEITGALVLPEGLETISSESFGRIDNLTSIYIPASVTSIEGDAFYRCLNLESIVVDANNAKYTSRNNSNDECNCVIDKATRELVFGCKTTTIPNDGSATSIGDWAFAELTTLTSISIPSTVESIGYASFRGTGLTGALVLPEGLKSIGEYAFARIRGITSVTIPASVTSIETNVFEADYTDQTADNYQEYINAGALTTLGGDNIIRAALTSLTTVNFASGSQLTYLPDLMFHMQFALTQVNNIPNTVETIGWETFGWCSSLASITLPNSIERIGWACFQYCAFETITLPENLTTIADAAFQMCKNLTSITIPASVTTLGSGENGESYPYLIFTHCKNLTSVTFENPNGWKVTSYDGSQVTSLSAENLANPATAASYLKSTYSRMLWTRDDDAFLTYSLSGDESYYKVTGIDSNFSGPLVIPATHNGKPVKVIATNAFKENTAITSVIIPTSVTNIGLQAFKNCTGLTNVFVPSSVTTIETDAFSGCSNVTTANVPYNAINPGYLPRTNIVNLTINSGYILSNAFSGKTKLKTLTIGNGVTSINENAFKGCSGLTRVILSDSITTIGTSAFENCTALENVVMSNNIQIISESSFSGCDNLIFNTYDNAYYLASSTNPYALLVKAINTSINSCNIHSQTTAIGPRAFDKCSNLTNINLPTELKSICENAFDGCSSLTSINIPSSVTSIDAYAFSSCSNLATGNIPDSVTYLGRGIFNNCSNLTEASLPNGITEIGKRMFSGCEKLTDITIPDSVTTIGDYAFWKCSMLANITLPSVIDTIGVQAFYRCYEFTSITIPSSVVKISQGAFEECSNLISVVFEDPNNWLVNFGEEQIEISAIDLANPATAATYLKSTHVARIWTRDDAFLTYSLSGDETYYTVTGIDSNFSGPLVIPATHNGNPVKAIANNAFNGNTKITSVTILDGIIEIEENAFQGCSGLIRVVLPDSITTIGTSAFENCTALENVVMSNNIQIISESSFSGCDNLIFNTYDNAYYLASSTNPYALLVKAINTSINSCNIHSQTTAIGPRAFNDCSDLANINLPTELKSICENAFDGCSSLTSINIPSSVNTIDAYAFSSCSNLATGNIPDNVTYLGRGIFNNCSNLTEASLPNGITEIGKRMFSGCEKLANITIPDSVTTIGDYAFYGCHSLSSNIIPIHVKSIGNRSFYQCSGLTTLNLAVHSIGEGAFASCDKLETVNLQYAPVRIISKSAFESDTSLTTVITSEFFETIEERAFAECISLTEININNVTTIGANAFNHCKKLKTVYMSSVETIGEGAFARCNVELKGIIIPRTAKSLGVGAFNHCNYLSYIVLGTGITTIEDNTFNDCPKLKTVYYAGSESEYSNVTVSETGNTAYNNASIYFYSATNPGVSGNYWHYDSGKIVLW